MNAADGIAHIGPIIFANMQDGGHLIAAPLRPFAAVHLHVLAEIFLDCYLIIHTALWIRCGCKAEKC